MLNCLRILLDARLSRLGSQRGASALEYGVLAAGIVTVIVGAMFIFGAHARNM